MKISKKILEENGDGLHFAGRGDVGSWYVVVHGVAELGELAELAVPRFSFWPFHWWCLNLSEGGWFPRQPRM